MDASKITAAPIPPDAYAELGAATYIGQWLHDRGYDRQGRDAPLFLRRLRAADLSEPQIHAVLVALDTTCPHCWDADRPCDCMRDE